MTDTIRILGAGPAGLAAAIVLARAGRPVQVYERRSQVGARFHDDYQGLENWTVKDDVLMEIQAAGITTDFRCRPFTSGRIYNPRLSRKDVKLKRPLFYLVQRGPGPNTLDTALKEQALAAGADIRFNETLPSGEADIIATGPRGVSAIAAGLTFDTSHPDDACVVVGDSIAPQGYAYLLIANGRGTLATVLYSNFDAASECLQRSLEVFRRLLPFDMANERSWGGYGAFRIPTTAVSGRSLLVGEAAGFQDYLFGFGIRSAMLSGSLAARSLLTGEDYDTLWRRRLLPTLRSGEANRRLYTTFGSFCYYGLWFLLGYFPRPDLVMRFLYNRKR
jgi:flavin-dependent dehydrogenase